MILLREVLVTNLAIPFQNGRKLNYPGKMSTTMRFSRMVAGPFLLCANRTSPFDSLIYYWSLEIKNYAGDILLMPCSLQ